MTTTTTKSLDEPHVHLDVTAPAAYMRRMIISTLYRKGIEGAEAGVIAEMEMLLERHVQHLFELSRDHAQHAHRSIPNALDVLQAHQTSSHSTHQLHRTSKKRRRPIALKVEQPPLPPDVRETITSLMEQMENSQSDETDGNGESTSGGQGGGKGRKLEYAFDGAPNLPPKWTYPSALQPAEQPAAAKVTSAALNFVKATVADADIDPELGIVNYRKKAKS